ncbi:FAD/NAD(P)-binding protein [Glarea lozoyensis ATCC 20868]|uniref:FAD/NAD(P)-binding protein n=1 Tax=Glarea lozoyensis (strain ATCC 20868 / MF5171) TaxID=1116229 RepID=S3E4S4_GLAL2|nr:FAD/NAD(P)-binding protein [Glarea lozoyensis ATCC 20868]EPE33418.1 FAD/NAD(P)-binding protein [Glarea lozoyensis ATCC 20868]
MLQPRVLISGASVAGPALAYWLVRAGCKVTVVERASRLRAEGQGIDVRDTARDVIRQMGLFDEIKSKSSNEEGIRLMTKHDKVLAAFGVDADSGKGESATCDIEILRGELAKILVDATKTDVTYIWGDMIESLHETEKEIGVHFANSTPDASFDLVVGADGIGSKIRDLAFPKDLIHFRDLNTYISYFSIPKGEQDDMWAKVAWVGKGRYMAMRPDNIGRTRVFLNVTGYLDSDERLARFRKVLKEGVPAQKALLQELFEDAGWEASRLLEGMHQSDDFYLQHVAQVKIDKWSTPSGRVTMVGDAGFAPSPFSGMGTSIAFIGAYVLAGEISKQLENIPAALESYERILRPYVEDIQSLPPGIPWALIPQSNIGVKLLETVFRTIGFLSRTGVTTVIGNILGYLPFAGGVKFKLPEYEAFKKRS